MARTAIGMSRISLLFVSGLLLVLGSPAGAATVKFYKGGTGYTGPYSGAGTVYDNTKALATNCPTPAGCPGSGDAISDPMVFGGLGITATAGGPDANLVWNDLYPNFGGLGVGTGTPSHSDQIGGTDFLTLTFSQSVTLTGVGTLFVSAHEGFGTGFETVSLVNAAKETVKFLVSLDGGTTFSDILFSDANLMNLALVSTSFTFMAKVSNPTYYVSALSFATCDGPVGCAPPPPEVPIPGALPLFATGLIGLAWLGRRRKRKNAAALAT